MSSVLTLTFPGKKGDALLQWPVGKAICELRGEKADLWLDEKTLGPLVSLFAAQPCVNSVTLKPGIENWSMGGQPYHFGLSTEDHLDREFVHLGMRTFPARQITLQTIEDVPFKLDTQKIAREPSLVVPQPFMKSNRLILHGTFNSHHTGVPGFWRFLNSIRHWVGENFTEATFVGTEDERKRASDLYGPVSDGCLWDSFNDQGSFLELARLVASSRLVIACGSCVAALAGALKVPCLRVHDPIGDAAKTIWSNLGASQWNFTELELRKGEWERIKSEWSEAVKQEA